MSNIVSKEIHLISRPEGEPRKENFLLVEKEINSINEGEVLVKNLWMSVDPYMRGRMNDSKSYAAPVKIGQPMTGETVGTVIESKSDIYNVGDKLCIHKGWQTLIKAKDTDPSIYKVPDSNIPLSSYLGAVGMPGRTAYFGLNRVGKPKENDIVVVSAASGAVGSIVGQLAKLQGCNVIGIAGGSEKTTYVKDELNFNDCIDYKSDNFIELLSEACKDGIDIYFENVGGMVSRSVAKHLNYNSRVPICGFISQYNEDDVLNSDTPFKIFGSLDTKPEHRFFVVTEWMDEWTKATEELSRHIVEGKINYKETITKGFVNSPQALRDVLTCKNFGKQIIDI